MELTVLTLFPGLINAFFDHGIIARALDKGLVTARAVNIRDYAFNTQNSVDDRPYGGGCGMVMTPEPLLKSVRDEKRRLPDAKVIMMSPQGKPFDQKKAYDMASARQGFIFVCGRYEGIDERVFLSCVDEELSVGDYVMTGGEIGAMAVMDALIRLIPGVLGGDMSAEKESFQNERLEHAHYTRPSQYEGMEVPDVLLSGDHGKIEQWRLESSLKRTLLKRPDLFEKRPFSPQEKAILKRWCHAAGLCNG
ncbi:MAG: tRNA (guanosine(37)-N1)-methyltransferase TrmD [Desulfamplus sp.]|nr:tRNA (guanosine(37)-N1)-methyltransferase TrmD [Desulfamplus sp.]